MITRLALDISPSLKCNIAVILNCKYSNFSTKLIETQRQIGMHTGVIFVYSCCYSLDPHNIQFKYAMRAQFNLCVDK